jgi:hypothetical protein
MSIHKKRGHPWLQKKNIPLNRDMKAVSEIMGTILLLSISIILLSLVYLLVLNNATNPSNTARISSSDLVASVDEKNVYMLNDGGVPLSKDTKLIITVSGQRYFATVKDCLIDINGDGQWNIGEHLIFTPPGFASLKGLEVSVEVITPENNAMLMYGVVQEGFTGNNPYVQTLDPHDVWPHSAYMKCYYNFISGSYLPGKTWFQWKEATSTSWNLTPKIIIVGPFSGYQDVPLYGLTSNRNYLYEAWIQYTSGNTTINISGGVNLFTTQIDAMGIWHFDETSGIQLLDSSGQFPPNDGTRLPNDIRGPPRLNAELNHSVKSLSFDGIDDYGQVPNSNTLSVTDECSIETWINRSVHSDSLVGIPIQSSLAQFGAYSYGCYDPDVVHVTGGIYAIVSANENSQGYLVTVNITNTGQIISNATTCFIDVFNFEPSSKNQKIIQINETNGIYAIVYNKPSMGNQLYLKTVQIFSNGRINKTAISTRVLDALLSYTPDIIHIDGVVYAVAYTINVDFTGALLSVNISDNGIISPVNKRLVFTGDVMQEPEIIKVVKSTDIYVIVYNCVGDDGGLRTVEITNQGNLFDVSHHVWFDDNDGGNPEILYIHGDMYAIVYAGPIKRQSGYLKTIEIKSDGNITLIRDVPPLVKSFDTFIFEMTATFKIRQPRIIPVDGGWNYYAISYSVDTGAAVSPGKIVTVKIDDNGNVWAFTQLTVTFEPFFCQTPILFNVFKQVYGVVYRADPSDGMLKTLRIDKFGKVNASPIYDFNKLGAYNCYDADEILTANGQYVAAVFRSINNCLLLKTVKVNATSKTISNEFTDSYTLEKGYTSSNGSYDSAFGPTIIRISNKVYAISYCQYIVFPVVRRDGKIKTVYINDTGHITPLDTYKFDADCMNAPFTMFPLNQSNGVYAVAYQLASTSKGILKTIKIDVLGNIIGTIDSYVFENLRCQEPSMIRIGGDVHAIIYRDSLSPSTYGRIVTLKIYGNGTIIKSLIDSWQFTPSCYHPKITQVTADIFAFVYSQYYGAPTNLYYAWVTTVKIASNGSITKSFIDSFASATAYYTDNFLAHQPIIFRVVDRIYGIIYKDLPAPWNLYQYNGWLATLRIGENGDIIDTVDGAVKISSNPRVNSYDAKIIPFVGDSYIALYGGLNNDTYMCVLRIPISETTQNVFSKQNSYTVRANKTKAFVTFTDSNNQPFTLSGNLSGKWNYIVSTYDKTTMKLYINAVLVGSLPVNGKQLKVTANNLLFGPYSGYYDEFSLYAAILSSGKITQNYDYYRPP